MKTNSVFQKNLENEAGNNIPNIPSLIEELKCKPEWENGELNAMILLKNPFKKVVLTALHEGTKVESFQSSDSITIQVIEGKLKYHSENESVTLEKDQFLTIYDNINYSLKAKEDTVILLSITSNTLQTA